ncbi:hypothetical protein HK405_015050, partial [Cladochytrium tenue]
MAATNSAMAPAPANVSDSRNLFVPADLSTADAAAVARIAAGESSDTSGADGAIYMLNTDPAERKRLHMQ